MEWCGYNKPRKTSDHQQTTRSRRDEGRFPQRAGGTTALPEPVLEIPNLQNFDKAAYVGLSHQAPRHGPISHLVCGNLVTGSRHGPIALFSPVFHWPPGPCCALPRKLTPTVKANCSLTSSWVWLVGTRQEIEGKHVYRGWVMYYVSSLPVGFPGLPVSSDPEPWVKYIII